MRARLCGRDFKVKDERDDLFAAMPPLEAKATIFQTIGAEQKGVAEWDVALS